MTNKQIIENWVKNTRYKNVEDVKGRTYIEWSKDIWKKTYDEIVEYLMKRFERINNAVEYYYCLLYLEKHLSKKLRYLPYEESDQHKRSIGIKIDNSKIQKKVGTVTKFSMMR
jgi:hypothetical protein